MLTQCPNCEVAAAPARHSCIVRWMEFLLWTQIVALLLHTTFRSFSWTTTWVRLVSLPHCTARVSFPFVNHDTTLMRQNKSIACNQQFMLYRTSSLQFMSQQSSWAYTCFRARRLLKFVSSTETIEKKSSSWPRCKHLLTGRWESDTLPIQKGNILDRYINAPILLLTRLCGNYNCVHKHGLNEISTCHSNMSLQNHPPQLLSRQSP